MEEDIKEIKCFFNKNFFVNSDWASIHRNEITNLEEAIENLLERIYRISRTKRVV